MASVPSEIIIWVWKAVIWAYGSSTPVKAIFGPMKLAGITVSMIACENGMGRALTGMGEVRSSVERSPMRCKSLRSSLLALRSSLLFACDAAKSSWYQFWLVACSAWTSTRILSWSALDTATACWRARMVSMSYCMETLSPSSSKDAPFLVFLMLLDDSQHDCGWDLVLSGPMVGARCSRRLTQPPLTSKANGGSSYFLVDSALSLGDREWLRWNRGGPTCWLHSDDHVSTWLR